MTAACAKVSLESLTPREHNALDAIASYYRANGVSPSHDELRRALGLGHDGFVRRLVSKLRDKGFIDADRGERRALRVLFTADGQPFESNTARAHALEDRLLAREAELSAARRAGACVVLVPRAASCEPGGAMCSALRRVPRRRR